MESEGRICDVKIEPGVKVHTAWDLGVGDATAIWAIQCVGRSRHLVEYYEASGVPLHHFVEKLNEWKYRYHWSYGQHFLPHDAKQRELQSAMSRIETLRSLGIEPEVVAAHHPLDGINAVRRMLDRTWIDAKRCERGIECLRAYRYDWKEKQRTWSPWPVHDWSSHCCDALRTFATGYDDPSFTTANRARERYSPPIVSTSHWAS